MNLKVGQKVIHKSIMQEGTVLSVGNKVAKVVFDDGEEVKRFQADLSFKMVATKNEIQDYIDELLMSKF